MNDAQLQHMRDAIKSAEATGKRDTIRAKITWIENLITAIKTNIHDNDSAIKVLREMNGKNRYDRERRDQAVRNIESRNKRLRGEITAKEGLIHQLNQDYKEWD